MTDTDKELVVNMLNSRAWELFVEFLESIREDYRSQTEALPQNLADEYLRERSIGAMQLCRSLVSDFKNHIKD